LEVVAWTVASVSSLSTINQLDSVVIAPVVVLVIVADNNVFDVANFFDDRVKSRVDRLAANDVDPVAVNIVEVPHVEEFGNRDVEEGVAG
jgi:hypothetical protein